MIAAEMGVMSVLDLIITEIKESLPIPIETGEAEGLPRAVWSTIASISENILSEKNSTVVVMEEHGVFFVTGIFRTPARLNWKKGDVLVPRRCRVVSSSSVDGFELWYDHDISFGDVFEIIEYDGGPDVYCRCLSSLRTRVIPTHFLEKPHAVLGGLKE